MTCENRRRDGSAFTLVELLVVMGIIGILLAAVVPAVTQALRGSNLTQSGQMVGDQIVLARQAAITSNRIVQVRFYQLPVTSAGSATNFAAVQCFRMEENGQATPLTKLQALRSGVIFASDATHSSILAPPTPPTVSGTAQLPAYGNQKCAFVGFQFLPNGSTDLDPTAPTATYGGWFLTLVDTVHPVPSSGPPINFYTLRIEALSGRCTLFRP